MAEVVEGAATTAEKSAAYLAALEEEKAGYEARAASLKAGGSDALDGAQLDALVKGCEAEIKRVKPAAKKAADDA